MNKFEFKKRDEENIRIPIPETSLHINATLRGGWSQPVIILIHGLPGSSFDPLSLFGSKYLAEHGFSTLRVNLYDYVEGTRDLIDCTLQTHANDLDTIIDFLRRKKVESILAAGHSYGGLTILRSSADLNGAVLWDPSHFRCSIECKDNVEDEELNKLEADRFKINLSGKGYLDPVAMVEERKKYKDLDESELVEKTYPLLFIAAEKGNLLPYIKTYYQKANDPKKLKVIKDATHSLIDSDAVLFETLEETKNWFEKSQQKHA